MTVPFNTCRCGATLKDGKCPNFTEIRVWGGHSSGKVVRAVTRKCQGWLRAHVGHIHGALYDISEDRIYFFPIHAVAEYDEDLEASLCDLELEVSHSGGYDIELSVTMALPGSMKDTRDFADFVIESDKCDY